MRFKDSPERKKAKLINTEAGEWFVRADERSLFIEDQFDAVALGPEDARALLPLLQQWLGILDKIKRGKA